MPSKIIDFIIVIDISLASTGSLYLQVSQLLAYWFEQLPGAKFTLRPSFAFYIGSVTARHSSSVRQPNFAA